MNKELPLWLQVVFGILMMIGAVQTFLSGTLMQRGIELPSTPLQARVTAVLAFAFGVMLLAQAIRKRK
jgi:hypothetical protein